MASSLRSQWFIVIISLVIWATVSGCTQSASHAVEPLPAEGLSPSMPATTLGIVIDPTGVVVALDARSIAKNAGMQTGDILIRIDDIVVHDNVQAVRTYIRTRNNATLIIAHIQRNNQILALRIERIALPIEPALPSPILTPTPVVPPFDYL